MPDVHAAIAQADEAVQEQLAGMLELRAADVQQRAMLEDYLAELPSYMLTIVERGADALVASGTLGEAAGEALKSEVRRRADAGEFFGSIAYVSLIARRPE